MKFLDLDALQSQLMAWLFPLLIISVTFGQVRPTLILVWIGQVVSVLTVAVAVSIVLLALPRSIWPLILIGGVLIMRGIRITFPGPNIFEMIYTMFAVALFSAAGALVISRRPGLLQRQFVVFCMVSIPIMVAQMLGFQWSQVLRTDGTFGLGAPQSATLFVPVEQLTTLDTLQLRPAGLMYANNVTSIIVTLGLALYYGRPPQPTRTWMDGLVIATAVLLMARITYLAMILTFWVRFRTDRAGRRHVLVSIALMVLFLGLYRVFFPGLFAVNMSWSALLIDFQARLADLLIATGIPFVMRLANLLPADVLALLSSSSSQSGYAEIARRWQSLLPSVLLSIPYVFFAMKELRRFDTRSRNEVIMVAVAAILLPLITSFLTMNMFWFLAGAALLPVWQMIDPAFRPKPESLAGVR